jgi:hypothetical protein
LVIKIFSDGTRVGTSQSKHPVYISCANFVSKVWCLFLYTCKNFLLINVLCCCIILCELLGATQH